jgi:tetratricopeptide (TPR) repeat protein
LRDENAGELMEADANPTSSRRRLPRILSRLSQRAHRHLDPLVTIITAVCFVIGAATAVIKWTSSDSSPKLEPMSGTLNVAVTPFRLTRTSNDVGRVTSVSRTLAQGFASALDRDMTPKSGYDVQVGLRDLGVTRASRAEDVEKKARSVLAHIVIFGTARTEGDRTIVEAFAYLRSSALPQSTEIAGLNRLGEPIAVDGLLSDGDPQLLQTIRGELTDRAAGTAHFVQALLMLADDQYSNALAQLKAVAEGPSGQLGELRDQFVATTYLKMRQLDQAERVYLRIVGGSESYARAWLGLAEVELQRAIQENECDGGSVESHLTAARVRLDRAAGSTQPAGAFIREKVAIARVRLGICARRIDDSLRTELNDTVDELRQQGGGSAMLAVALMARGVAREQSPDPADVVPATEDFRSVLALPGSRLSHGLAELELGVAYRRQRAVAYARHAFSAALALFTAQAAVGERTLTAYFQRLIAEVRKQLADLH